LHIAVVGTGNVGRTTAFYLLARGLADELSLVDIKPGLARAVAEEFKHASSGLRIETAINWFDRDEDLSGADLIIISAGYPRLPGQKISRRDLAGKNAEIIKFLAEVLPPNNPGARYVVVTNPVDAMATLFKRVSGAGFVISTGTHLEKVLLKCKIQKL
jgi:malate dehydrogenase